VTHKLLFQEDTLRNLVEAKNIYQYPLRRPELQTKADNIMNITSNKQYNRLNSLHYFSLIAVHGLLPFGQYMVSEVGGSWSSTIWSVHGVSVRKEKE
jgi:hypothetical protein